MEQGRIPSAARDSARICKPEHRRAGLARRTRRGNNRDLQAIPSPDALSDVLPRSKWVRLALPQPAFYYSFLIRLRGS
jgi:hypothetical protein